jgi:NACalpha-BTF3-like transcription factor
MTHYKIIEGKKMDSRLLDMAMKAVEGAGDGRISKEDAEKILAAVKDGDVYTDVERETLAYIRHHFKWTDVATEWFTHELTRWQAPDGKLTMTPAFDVLSDPEKKEQRKHDLHTAMNETQQDHDDIGLIFQLASGERVQVMCNFIEMSGDFVELKGGYVLPVRAIEKVEI